MSIWLSCSSTTSSGRLEIRSPSSMSTLLDSRTRCSWRSTCDSGVVVFHCMSLKLQKPVPIDLVGGSQETSPTVHAPSKPKDPRSPDSVTNQYSFSLISKSTVYLSFPTLCCGAISASVSDSWAPVGVSEVVFTQHLKDFLVFVVRMSPFHHHPLILNPHHSSYWSLCMLRSWWKTAFCRGSDHSLSLVFHIVHLFVTFSFAKVLWLSRLSIESHR